MHRIAYGALGVGHPEETYGLECSPTSSDGCRCDATERRFLVKGSWMDGDKRIQLRLRICEPTGKPRPSGRCLACQQQLPA